MNEETRLTQAYPATPAALAAWTWPEIAPHYQRLGGASLTAETLPAWLADWSALAEHVDELSNRLVITTDANTADEGAEARYQAFLKEIFPRWKDAENTLKCKLLASGLSLPGMEIPLRDMRADAGLFRAENLPLLSEEQALASGYNKITGAQKVTWRGEELTVSQLEPFLSDPDRSVREAAWRLGSERWLADRAAINQLWQKLLDLRLRLARNAGMPDFRAFRWAQLKRFDYTPQDARSFHAAIEQVVVPAAARIYERRRRRLGVSSLRPWDLSADPAGLPPLRPFRRISTLKKRVEAILGRVDPVFGRRFERMDAAGLLDLENRPNKAPGGFCESLASLRLPFVFMNAVGVHDNVQTLLHESGHAMHVFESAPLLYFHQMAVPAEFAEVASMSMELLGGPYLGRAQGGFYSKADAARARTEHLEGIILFWPYMAVVDAFQHWAYENPAQAADPAACDAAWSGLWRRFMPGVDWSGLEDALATGWHRKLHIHQAPFYYIDYGLAQLGAIQVWASSLRDAPSAVAAYRSALALGGTAPLPDLYRAAGAALAFDPDTLAEAVQRIENTLDSLDQLPRR